MRKLWFVMLFGLVLSLAACGGDGGSEEAAATATNTPPPTRTPLPGTWTPSPQGFVATMAPAEATATSGPVASPVSGGQALPATWTPLPDDFQRPTSTPAPVNTAPGAEATPEQIRLGSPVPPGPTATAYPEACATFELTAADERVFIGTATGVAWRPVEGAVGYHFVLRHQGGGIMIEETLTSTLLEIPEDTFQVQGVYGWELTPIDANGDPMCATLGIELYALFGG